VKSRRPSLTRAGRQASKQPVPPAPDPLLADLTSRETRRSPAHHPREQHRRNRWKLHLRDPARAVILAYQAGIAN